MAEKAEQNNTLNKDKEPVRMVALSDGVFATVLTFLVLDLKVPEIFLSGGGSDADFLESVGPHLFSYVLTFLVTGTYWLAHHGIFDHVIRYDNRLLRYNLLFLLFIGLLPFSTAAISLDEPQAANYPLLWTTYSLNIALAGIMLTLTWNYAVSHLHAHPEISAEYCRYVTVRQLITPLVFLVSIATEYIFPKISLGMYTLLVIPLANVLVERHYAAHNLEMNVKQSGRLEYLWRAGTFLPWLLVISFAIWAANL